VSAACSFALCVSHFPVRCCAAVLRVLERGRACVSARSSQQAMVAAARDTLSSVSADDATPVHFVVEPTLAARTAAPAASAFGGLSAGAGAGNGPIPTQEVDL
jgi:hypothetical protein